MRRNIWILFLLFACVHPWLKHFSPSVDPLDGSLDDSSWTLFFRPTPDGSRQVVYPAGKTIAFCKFTELMQWQHQS